MSHLPKLLIENLFFSLFCLCRQTTPQQYITLRFRHFSITYSCSNVSAIDFAKSGEYRSLYISNPTSLIFLLRNIPVDTLANWNTKVCVDNEIHFWLAFQRIKTHLTESFLRLRDETHVLRPHSCRFLEIISLVEIIFFDIPCIYYHSVVLQKCAKFCNLLLAVVWMNEWKCVKIV